MEMGESKMEVMKTNRVGRPLANYRKDLLEKHGRKCGYCDSELTVPESIEIDHFSRLELIRSATVSIIWF